MEPVILIEQRTSTIYTVSNSTYWSMASSCTKNAKEEVLMKCITQEVGIALLKEIHSGTCGNHAAS
jgi:hypothetical protein